MYGDALVSQMQDLQLKSSLKHRVSTVATSPIHKVLGKAHSGGPGENLTDF